MRQHAQEQVRDQPETEGEGVVDEAVLSAGDRDRDEMRSGRDRDRAEIDEGVASMSVAFRGTQRHSAALRGNQQQSAAISSPYLIREQRAAVACVLQRVGDVGERMDLMREAIGDAIRAAIRSRRATGLKRESSTGHQ
jgi:hypothetical protein